MKSAITLGHAASLSGMAALLAEDTLGMRETAAFMQGGAAMAGILRPDSRIRLGGTFHGKLIREGEVVDEFEVSNLVTNQGLDYMLAAAFGTSAPVTSWFLAPFTNNYTPVGTDTASSFPAAAGEATSYTASTRVPYIPVEGGQQVTNSASPASFTFNKADNVYGAFLISSQAQGSTAGTLLAAAQFGTLKAVQPSDQLLLTYIFAAASA